MSKIKKAIIAISLLTALSGGFMTPIASAQGILPSTGGVDCDAKIKGDWASAFKSKDGFTGIVNGDKGLMSNILGCAVKTGRIRFFMMPFFIVYLIQFLLGLAGLIAVLFVVYGGFWYVIGGISEDKEKGKKIVKNALIGLVVSLSSWIVINFIQVVLTS